MTAVEVRRPDDASVVDDTIGQNSGIRVLRMVSVLGYRGKLQHGNGVGLSGLSETVKTEDEGVKSKPGLMKSTKPLQCQPRT